MVCTVHFDHHSTAEDARKPEEALVDPLLLIAAEPLDPEGTSEKIIKLASAPIALSDPDDFERLVEAKIKNCGECKLSVAIVGAGDFYFRAKKFFNDRYGKEI